MHVERQTAKSDSRVSVNRENFSRVPFCDGESQAVLLRICRLNVRKVRGLKLRAVRKPGH